VIETPGSRRGSAAGRYRIGGARPGGGGGAPQCGGRTSSAQDQSSVCSAAGSIGDSNFDDESGRAEAALGLGAAGGTGTPAGAQKQAEAAKAPRPNRVCGSPSRSGVGSQQPHSSAEQQQSQEPASETPKERGTGPAVASQPSIPRIAMKSLMPSVYPVLARTVEDVPSSSPWTTGTCPPRRKFPVMRPRSAGQSCLVTSKDPTRSNGPVGRVNSTRVHDFGGFNEAPAPPPQP
jgi:hypothetical protein